jgi:hypothetical protein
MKKIAILAATALASTLAFAAPASAQSIEVGRQTLLDNGSAPATLRTTLKAQVTSNGTHRLDCTLNAPTLTTPSASEDFAALNVPTSSSETSNTPVNVGEVILTYNGRINPKGMAVGDAMYAATLTPVAASSQSASGLSCPAARDVSVGFRAAVAGDPGQPFIAAVAADPGQPFIAAVEGKEAVYGTMPEPICKALALADAPGRQHDKVSDCPKVPDLSNLISAAVEAVAGQAYRAPVEAVIGQEFRPAIQAVDAVPAQTVTISYTPTYSFSQTNISVTVDGQNFTF